MVGKKKRWAFANFVDKFRRRIEGWILRYLSMGARKCSLSRCYKQFSYMLCSVLLYRKPYVKINQLREFIGVTGVRYWAGISGHFLFIKSLLAKQVWRLLSQPDFLLAKILFQQKLDLTPLLPKGAYVMLGS
ncbi:hypothetical protein EPI10_017166 [Gossypium australe]|uniref:Uncharacterized protein n=1 Tax=Gossypium australe TaxID=47621 RepID=A0A5B6VR34_9ROSI|nr:hypothetical protein EPI10_017166 [Gossypium australe]